MRVAIENHKKSYRLNTSCNVRSSRASSDLNVKSQEAI